MILTLNDTSTKQIADRLESMHIRRGEDAQGRVLTLLISCRQEDLEPALKAANAASWEHPCRVIAIVPGSPRLAAQQADDGGSDNGAAGGPADSDAQVKVVGPVAPNGLETVEVAGDKPITAFRQDSRLDAEIRFGADAGASEIIVLKPSGELVSHLDTLVIPLMVADTPVTVWWPGVPPTNPSKDPLGRLATVRITDAANTPDPAGTFARLSQHDTPQDVDLSWTHLTLWRAQLASMLDQSPHSRIRSAQITGQNGNLSVLLLAGWINVQAHVPVRIVWNSRAEGIQQVSLQCDDGDYVIDRCSCASPQGAEQHDADTSGTAESGASEGTSKSGTSEPGRSESGAAHPGDSADPTGEQAWVTTPGSPKPQMVSLPHRTRTECLGEELGRLYPDKVWARVVQSDLSFEQSYAEED
jgi:glucose-6-phosphate dehydrogenase assembly protein OpcA